MPTAYLGIDIAKNTFDAALITQDGKPKHRSFPNQENGFQQLQDWLRLNFVTDLHACLEATNTYQDDLARFLVAHGYSVSVVNPAALRAFARTELARTKTDKADAIRIARYCQMHRPRLWAPPSEEVSLLQALMRRRETLGQMLLMESQRLEQSPVAIKNSLNAIISALKEQIAIIDKQIDDHIDSDPSMKHKSELLQTIPGIGATTAANLLCELGDVTRFCSARQVAAYAGLAPRLRESGTSVRSRATLCKIGNARLRKSLYFPAISALRYNPVLMAMSKRLLAAGKSKMAIIGAAMRRLIHLAFGVLKSGKPFDANIALRCVQQS